MSGTRAFADDGVPLTAAVAAQAQTTAFPSASPAAMPAASPSATPAPRPTKKPKRLTLLIDSSTSYTNNQMVGPGIVPPEAAVFAAGSPISPGTPYDFWTSAPLVTGYGIVQSLKVTPVLKLSQQYNASVTLGYGSISGNGNVAAYWGDQPLETVNPHLGSRAVSVPPRFPTTNKDSNDVVSGTRGSIIGGAIGRIDGSLVLHAGYFDLGQTEPYVFVQPAQTNAPQQFTEPLPEGIGESGAGFPLFTANRSRLPLHGISLFAKPSTSTSVELADAELPAMPGTSARMRSASVQISRTSRLSYGAMLAKLDVGGDPQETTVLFGGNPRTYASAQGPLPASTIGGQHMVVGGVRAAFPITLDSDMQIRLARSCYHAESVALTTASCTAGNLGYAKLHKGFLAFDLALEYQRYEATYAPAQLPYGSPENVWSIAWSWPGTWFKGEYPFADVSVSGPNREGFRLSGNTIVRGVEARLAYGRFNQLSRYDAGNAFTPGFTEGFFLPQLGASGTLGRETHAAASFIAHPKAFDAQLDLTDITMARDASALPVNDGVSMDYPAATLTLSRQLSPKFYGAIGAGRYAAKGTWNGNAANADLAERAIFLGLQFMQTATSGYSLKWTNFSVSGAPTIPSGPSPAFHGPQVTLEQRFKT